MEHSNWKEIKYPNSNMTFGYICENCKFVYPARLGKSFLFPEDMTDELMEIYTRNLPECGIINGANWWTLEWLWK